MARLPKNSILNGISGAIGKVVVLKQYGDKTVVSKYPDMSRVKRSALQKDNSSVFARAVAYAKDISRNPREKALWQEKIGMGKSVYHAALKAYLKRQKEE